MTQLKTLKFETILQKALKDWPDEIYCPIMTHRTENSYKLEGLYRVDGLYVGHETEVIMENMNSAIFIVIHKALLYTDKINTKNLRPETVKDIFDDIMRNTLKMPDLGWTEADRSLINKYFQDNIST